MKNENLRKLINLGIIITLVFSVSPMTALTSFASQNSMACLAGEGTPTSATNQMLHFAMKVRWGNVIGEPSNISEAKFDGLINVSENARVSLERTLLFEKHNSNGSGSETLSCITCSSYVADKITKRKDPVSWNSLIYNHWDGVKALVSSPANDNIIIKTTQGTITKTAKELYEMNEPYIQDVGEGKEIVVKVYPIKNPRYFLKVLWGNTKRVDYEKTKKDIVNTDIAISSLPIAKRAFALHYASGNFKLNSGGTLGFIKTLRFEGKDKIVPTSSSNEIAWESYVSVGVDGILTKLNLDINSLDKADTVTLNFTEVNNTDGAKGWSKNFNVVDLYHDKITTATVKGKYGVILQVWRKPNRSLIRVKNKLAVYIVEDGIKQPIPSPEVLISQGLTFDDVEVIEQDESDTYADGDAVCYADGSIVQEEGKLEVYVVADGEKKHIQDVPSFEALGYNWSSIVKVKPGVLGLYRIRTALKFNSVHPEGALIREVGNPTVYLIEGGKKKPISSLNIFNARRLDWNKVLVVGKAQIDKFEIGANLQYPDGSLLEDPSGKVYKMDQGKKRWVRSSDDLTGAGYSAEKIIKVVNSVEVNDLTITEEGNDIVADDIQ